MIHQGPELLKNYSLILCIHWQRSCTFKDHFHVICSHLWFLNVLDQSKVKIFVLDIFHVFYFLKKSNGFHFLWLQSHLFFITKNFVSVSSHVKIRLVFGIVSVLFFIVTKTPYVVVMSTGTVVTWSARPQGLAPTTFSMKPTKHQKASTSSSIRNNIGERRSLMPCT